MSEPYQWRAADLEADASWRSPWSGDELHALRAWAAEPRSRAILSDPSLINDVAADAPPILVERAERIRSELIEGRGFTVVSGLETSVGRAELAVAFVLFGALVGAPRSQNAVGHLLGHVVNVGADADDPAVRIYQTSRRQTFHTDSCDAVALLCLQPAASGGTSMVVSVESVYARMRAEAPELAARLFDPVATDRRGEQPEGEEPWFEIPVLTRSGHRVTGIYQRQYIDSATRFALAPRPDSGQLEALDLFDRIMNDPTMHFAMNFEPGDMQFVYNHGVMHDRTGFVDHPEPHRRRHLLRLWLSLPGDRALPEVFAQRYGTTLVGDRGGIIVEGTTPTITLSP